MSEELPHCRLPERVSGVLQVYQLMMPHYHYTMHINSQARAALINVNGIVEKVRWCSCCSRALR